MPAPYQVKAIKFLIQGGYGLFLDPGMRKTSITLAALSILIKKGIINKVLIIAPLRVCTSVWPVEARIWKDFNWLRVGVLHGKNKDKVAMEDLHIYVINPEGLGWFFRDAYSRIIPDALVVDESTSFKHVGTLRFKLLKPYLPRFKIRWVLTGSPVSNGYLGLFGQCYIADLGELLGRFVTQFKSKYFIQRVQPGQLYGKWLLAEGKDTEIQKLLDGKFLRLSAEDYIALPEMIVNDIRVELPPTARKFYNEMEKLFISEWMNAPIVAVNAGGSFIKCRQIASGGIYNVAEDWVPGNKIKLVGREVHSEKTQALREIINESNGSPVLIAFWYKHSRDRIRALIGDCPSIDGDCSDKDFMRIESEWNRGEIPYLLAHPQSMAHGLNMQHSGHTIVWYDIIPDYERYLQFNRRLIRSGSRNKFVIVHRLIAAKTVDEVNLMYLSRKGKSQNDFFDAINCYLQT